LAPNGEYLPVPVDQSTGSFLLHQGNVLNFQH
jgi:hypothetical protein